MFVESVILSTLNTDCKVGSYALHKTPIVFDVCRERFAVSWHKHCKYAILYKHDSNQSAAIASFILKTEKILNIKNNSSFALTNCDTILWVKPCTFWKACRIRRSLFTVLLRAGMNYNVEQDNYEDALFNHEYLHSTRDAVKRFLFGFVTYTGPHIPYTSVDVYGWRCTFSDLPVSKVKQYLISKKSSKSTSVPAVLESALWM
jgi:hypothetical protein